MFFSHLAKMAFLNLENFKNCQNLNQEPEKNFGFGPGKKIVGLGYRPNLFIKIFVTNQIDLPRHLLSARRKNNLKPSLAKMRYFEMIFRLTGFLWGSDF